MSASTRPTPARPAWFLVAQVELRRRMRNRSAIVTAFVGPVVLAVVFGVLLGGTSSLSITVGVVDADRSDVTAGFVAGLLDADGRTGEDDPVTFVALDPDADAAAVRAAVDRDDVDAAIVIPAGFGDAVVGGGGATLEVVRDPDGQVSGEIAASVARQFAAGLESRVLAAATASVLGAQVAPADLATFVDPTDTVIARVEPSGTSLDPAAFFGVAMSIMFLFFTVSFAARSIVAERANGVVPRMLASSAAPSAIVGGKVLAVSVLGLSGFLTVWAVTELVFGAPWGSPIAVVVTMTATVAAIAGVATFVCGLARTEQQADGYTSMAAFVLALVGGNFVGPGQAPAALRSIARFTPNGQSLDAFTRIAVDGEGVAGVLGQIAALLAFGIVFGAIGLVRMGQVIRA
jgi:ABC-2 type transport system permease protein